MKSKPIQIPPEVAVWCDGPDQARPMDALVRAVIAVPHSENVKREAEWKKSRAKKKGKKTLH